MGNLPRSRQLLEAKLDSKITGHTTVLLKNRYRREFFRYEGGELTEYDCSRYRGNKVEMSREEEDVASHWSIYLN